MATKEEIDDIRTTVERGWYAGNIGDARTLLSALDDANKRIAELEQEAKQLCVSGYNWAEESRLYRARAESAESKLARIRELAYQLPQVGRNQLNAILDGKDTP